MVAGRLRCLGSPQVRIYLTHTLTMVQNITQQSLMIQNAVLTTALNPSLYFMKYKKVIKLTPQHLKERYGNGYVMLLKLSPDFPDVIPVKVFIKQHLPEAVLKVIKLFLRHLLTGPRASCWGLLGFGDHRSSYLILERLLMLSTIC